MDACLENKYSGKENGGEKSDEYSKKNCAWHQGLPEVITKALWCHPILNTISHMCLMNMRLFVRGFTVELINHMVALHIYIKWPLIK